MKHLLFSLTFLLSSILLSAQEGWKQYTTENSNIPSNQINKVITTISGDIWLATDKGIAKFNNGSFTTYDVSHGLSYNNVLEINDDSLGNIWLSYGDQGGGATFFDGITFTTYNSSNGLHSNEVYKLLKLGGKMVIGYLNSFDVFDGQTFISSNLGNTESLTQWNKNEVVFYKDVWAQVPGVSYLISFDGNDTSLVYQFVNYARINDMKYIVDNELFIVKMYFDSTGSYGSAPFIFSNNQFKIQSSRAVDVDKDQNGNYWIASYQNTSSGGSRGSLFKVMPNSREHFENQNGYRAENIYSITDLNQNLYLASDSGLIIGNISNVDESRNVLDLGQLRPNFGSTGGIGSDKISRYDETKFNNFADSTGRRIIFSSKLIQGGQDLSGQLHLAGGRYDDFDNLLGDYVPGPMGNDNVVRTKNGKVWKVDRAQIKFHQLNHMYSNYTTPKSIATWPAHGNTLVGEANCLAPFHDVNQDGVYNAADGDYPYIRGDQALYMIYNDNAQHFSTGGNTIGVEVHQMAYAYGYDSVGEELQNTIFVNYRIINRSSNSYTGYRVGLFVEGYLGNGYDDYVGSDSTLSLIYFYNGDAIDEDNGGAIGFGQNPPAVGVTFLNQRLSKFIYHNNGSGVRDSPQTDAEYYNYLNGRWKDGSPLIYGGTGYPITSPPYNTTNFMFSGDPVLNNGWTESNAGNTPADRRFIGSTGETDFFPDDLIELDVAYVYSRDTTLNNLQQVGKLKLDVATVRNWYDQQVYPQFTSTCNTLTSVEDEVQNDSKSEQFSIYPNPSDGIFNIVSDADKLSLKVTSIDGRVIQQFVVEGADIQMDLSDQPTGIYFITLETDHSKETRKVIVQ